MSLSQMSNKKKKIKDENSAPLTSTISNRLKIFSLNCDSNKDPELF